MSDGNTANTREVTVTRKDLVDLRKKLGSKTLKPKERELVKYLTEQAEMGMKDVEIVEPLWTWTYRF